MIDGRFDTVDELLKSEQLGWEHANDRMKAINAMCDSLRSARNKLTFTDDFGDTCCGFCGAKSELACYLTHTKDCISHDLYNALFSASEADE